ncbi:MAG: hypothetical protein C0609_03135 [Deltaproteobacteria bacterium]|nr:MAG: hypothetical protein C0609_03135 [Deltaproteobacteria bacterium]
MKKIFGKLSELYKKLLKESLRSARAFPSLAARPGAVAVWLIRSHVAQLILLLTLLLMPTIIPAASDKLMEAIYRPVTNKVLGVLPVRQKNPKLELRKEQARILLWYGSGFVVFMAFWLSIPGALKRSDAIASNIEGEADGLVKTKPLDSVILYRKALRFATSSSVRESIFLKTEKLDKLLVDVGTGDRTVVMNSPPPDREPSERYEVREEVGRGAMGVVLKARDTLLERTVAIKELPPHIAKDKELLGRFRREATLLAKLNHPGIVQIYDFAEFDSNAWIIMEFVEGEELEAVLARRGKLSESELLNLSSRIAEALLYAHAKGILHRDLKPSNILISESGIPKIADFGVARLTISAGETKPGTILGSPIYMSPEQAAGRSADGRSDIYSLGAIMYRAATGAPLFEGSAIEVIAKVLNKEPVPLRELSPDISEEMSALIMSMLSKDPAARPKDVERKLNSLTKTIN